MHESAATIDAAAASWVVKLDRGLTANEEGDLEAWMRADPRRQGALARAQAAWLHADRARAFRGTTNWRPPPVTVKAVRWAAAAAIIAGLSMLFMVWQSYSRTHLATAKGEIRKDSLADGSYVTLDTRSRISVQFEPQARIVRLESGEALFEVKKDSARPFVVHAGDVRIRAIGTAFVVRRDSDNEVEVTVTKGVVSVWRESDRLESGTRLTAGERAVVSPDKADRPVELTKTELAHAIAWKSGIIDLNGRTLSAAAAEFNRYNRQTVVISDPVLAGQVVVGRFQANDPLAFVSAAASMLDAHVRTDGAQLILEAGPAP